MHRTVHSGAEVVDDAHAGLDGSRVVANELSFGQSSKSTLDLDGCRIPPRTIRLEQDHTPSSCGEHERPADPDRACSGNRDMPGGRRGSTHVLSS